MANQEHLDILKQGVKTWNQWRKEHSDMQPDLKGADLYNANLQGVDLSKVIHTHRSETISVVEDGVVSSWEPIDKGKTKISRVAHHIEDDLVRRHRTDINFFEMQDSRVLLDDVNFRF